MTRRVSRRVPLISNLAPLRAAVRAQTGPSEVARRWPNRRTRVVPQGLYRRTISAGALPNGNGAGTVPASGTVTIYVGPAGMGTIWFPTMAVIATTSGANDTSTCSLYLSPVLNGTSLASQPQIGGQSYAGGGDTIGLSVPPVYPGTYLIAVWTGAKQNDLATLTVYGTLQALVT